MIDLNGIELYYRVHLSDGNKYLGRALAWDSERLRASISTFHATAKDGPHVVEFITATDYRKAGGR